MTSQSRVTWCYKQEFERLFLNEYIKWLHTEDYNAQLEKNPAVWRVLETLGNVSRDIWILKALCLKHHRIDHDLL